jgi:hypothetical protein
MLKQFLKKLFKRTHPVPPLDPEVKEKIELAIFRAWAHYWRKHGLNVQR